MTQILDATFDGVVFRPDKPLRIKPNTRVKISVRYDEVSKTTVADVAKHLFGVIDIDGPVDLSVNKQHLEGFGE